MACKHFSYSESDLDDRRQVVASAIASQRLEGLELDPDTLSDFNQFSSGAIDLDEVRARIEARFSPEQNSPSCQM